MYSSMVSLSYEISSILIDDHEIEFFFYSNIFFAVIFSGLTRNSKLIFTFLQYNITSKTIFSFL